MSVSYNSTYIYDLRENVHQNLINNKFLKTIVIEQQKQNPKPNQF